MTDQATPKGIDPNSVRKVVSVRALAAVAWRVFTEKMGIWWPLADYKIGKAKAVDAVSSRELADAGTNAGRTGAPVSGAPSSLASRPRVWCSPGTSLPTGSTTRV
jgi:hypothetical protein